jgi:hypothetical protein
VLNVDAASLAPIAGRGKGGFGPQLQPVDAFNLGKSFTAVIPGRDEVASPESRAKVKRPAVLPLDSGLRPSAGSGMTAE